VKRFQRFGVPGQLRSQIPFFLPCEKSVLRLIEYRQKSFKFKMAADLLFVETNSRRFDFEFASTSFLANKRNKFSITIDFGNELTVVRWACEQEFKASAM
jgi:hypothetical protein